MSKRQIFIIAMIFLISILILVDCFYNFPHITIPQLVFWIFIACLCESLPVYFSKDRVVTVTLAVLLALQLSHGTYLTTIIAAISTILYIIRNNDGTYRHTFNLPYYKTMANFSNFTISTFLPGLLYDFLLDKLNITDKSPFIAFAIFFYFTATFFINTGMISLFMKIFTGSSIIKTWQSNSLWCWPNYVAIAPIGYFLSVLYRKPNGFVYILLLLGPLLLARYSFKLYLDSKEQYYKTIQTLTAAIEAKDTYTEGHSRRVEHYAERIAQKLRYPPKRIESIRVAALLHDIGKIGIKDSILAKPGRLTDEEWNIIRQHPSIGIKILEEVTFPGHVKDAILHHHEKYGGGGYPDNLKGGQISTDAYILATADAYDAMTSDRPYRKALPKEAAIEIIRKEKGTHFHPEIADILISILEEENTEQENKTYKKRLG